MFVPPALYVKLAAYSTSRTMVRLGPLQGESGGEPGGVSDRRNQASSESA
jgi:hypothetical protein